MSLRERVLQLMFRESTTTPVDVDDALITFLDTHAPTAVRDEAIRYLDHHAKGTEGKFHVRGALERTGLKSQIARMARIVACRDLRFEGMGLAEMRSLRLVLHHLEQEITTLRRKTRQPWIR